MNPKIKSLIKKNHLLWTSRGFFFPLSTLYSILPTSSLAQITFERTYGGTNFEEGWSVQSSSDGGNVLAGFTNSFGAGGEDVYLIRTDSLGDTIWTKTFGGTGLDISHDFQMTSDGGYILTGKTNSFGAGSYDVYVIKTDSLGDTLWTRTYGGLLDDAGYSVNQTTDQGYIITGETNSFGAGSYDAYLIRTDSLGDTLWTRTFGGTGFDGGYAVQSASGGSDGGFIITGHTNSFGAGGDDVFLIRTDSLGETLWTRTFGGVLDERGESVDIASSGSDGGYIIAGWTTSFGAGSFDIYLIRTDSLGDTLWSRTYGDSGWDAIFSVQSISGGSDRGYILAGFTNSFGAGSFDVYVLRTDSLGDTLWTRTFGGTDYEEGYSAQETSDGGFVILGDTRSFGAGGDDVYLIKTDGNGRVVGVEETDSGEFRTPHSAFRLFQNHPNPFHHSTLIRYSIPGVPPKADQGSGISGLIPVRLAIYDLTGCLIETLVNQPQEPGIYQLPISSHQLPSSGIYFYRLETRIGLRDYSTSTKKLTLFR